MKVVDTSVAVDHLRGVVAATEALRGAIEAGERLVASEVVRFELLAGVRTDARGPLEDFFGEPDWVPVTEPIARRGSELAREFRASHSGIDVADYLIVATVELLEAQLLTTNLRHFPMIEGLRAPS